MPRVEIIIYYYRAFVNRFFTKNVIFLRDIYQYGRTWKPSPASYSQRLLLEERLRISGGEVVPQGILNKRCKAATPHPSASLTPVSLRLGHAAGLTAHWAVIQYRGRRFTTLKGKARVHVYFVFTTAMPTAPGPA